LIRFDLALHLLNVAAGLILELLHLPLYAPLTGFHAFLQRRLSLGHLFPNQESDQEKRANKSGDTKEDRRPRIKLRSDRGTSQ